MTAARTAHDIGKAVITEISARSAGRPRRASRRLGYRAKSCVSPAHATIINRVLTPSPDEIARARRIIAAFEAARVRSEDRVEVDGNLVEVPGYLDAKRLVAHADALAAAGKTPA